MFAPITKVNLMPSQFNQLLSLRGLCLLLAALSLAISVEQASAQTYRGIVDPTDLQRFGLVRRWQTQVQIDRARSRIAHITQHVSPTKAHTLYEVHYKGDIYEFSEELTNTFGEMIGKEQAKALALKKVDELKIQHDVLAKAAKEGDKLPDEPSWLTRVVPEISLYVVSDSALLQCLDGETGRTKWSQVVGNASYPTFAAAANDDIVAVVNGSTLYILDAQDGKEINRRTTGGAPGAGPGVSDLFAHVPMVSGMMESHNLLEKYDDVRYYRSYGRSIFQPLVTPRSIAWTTDRGHMYVGHSDKSGIRFRLDTNDVIASSPAFLAPNQIVATSTDGFCYCVHELKGDLLWRFSTGQPITEAPVPIVVDDAVYVVTDENVMFKVNSKLRDDRVHQSGDKILPGEHIWAKGGIYSFLGASDERVYCVGAAGRLTILDAKTGGRIGVLPFEGLDLKLRNIQTDRMFVGSKTGLIQCLHEAGNRYPIIHTGVDEDLTPAQEVEQADPAGPAAPVGGGDDPFAPKPGAGGDPFAPAGGGGDPFAPKPGAGGDPFAPSGGGADPFAPAGGGGEDPFGAPAGGADPFAPAGGADPFAP